MVVRPNQFWPARNPESLSVARCLIIAGIAVITGHQLRTFHQRLIRMPIRNTVTGSSVGTAVYRPCCPLLLAIGALPVGVTPL